jgi:hypothetical protein
MTAHNTANSNAEGKAVLAAIHSTAPEAPTACSAWTAHDLVAHLAAGAKEIADLIEEKLEGRPDRPTRDFEEREAPFRAMEHEHLKDQLVAHNLRKLAGYAAMPKDARVAFTGTQITRQQLDTHSRSEAAIHRWDLVGDDDIGEELLAQPELTSHAVWVLSTMSTLHESARALEARAAKTGHPLTKIGLRTEGRPDVVLLANPSSPHFEITSVDDGDALDVILTMPAHHRLLALWGRRPAALDTAVEGDRDLLPVVDRVLWPEAVPWG